MTVPARIVVEETYAAPPDAVFAAAVTYDDVKSSRVVKRAGAPPGACRAGDDVTLTSHLFGIVPLSRWRIRCIESDATRRSATTEEAGGPIRRYRHHLSVTDQGDGCSLYRDEIDFDAGWLTLLMRPAIRRLYENRHKKRKAALGLQP